MLQTVCGKLIELEAVLEMVKRCNSGQTRMLAANSQAILCGRSDKCR